jgi:hypothetical protein
MRDRAEVVKAAENALVSIIRQAVHHSAFPLDIEVLTRPGMVLRRIRIEDLPDYQGHVQVLIHKVSSPHSYSLRITPGNGHLHIKTWTAVLSGFKQDLPAQVQQRRNGFGLQPKYF